MTKSVFISPRRILAVIAFALPMTVGADATATPDPGHAEMHSPAPVMPSPLDPQTEVLKHKVLELNRQVEGLQRNQQYPAYSRVSVYFSVKVPGLLAEKIQVSIDGATPVQVKYDRTQSIALLNHGLDVVLQMNAAPGIHRLHAVFTGHYTNAKPDAPPYTQTLDAEFSKDQLAARLEIEMIKENFVSAPDMHLIQWIKAS